MKILYGVVGEGLGHASRSKVVITYLRSLGHTVFISSAGRAAALLAADVTVDGLTLCYSDGAVDLAGSAAKNLANFSRILSTGSTAWTYFDRFAPNIIFADFDALVSLYGRARGIPVVSIDNMQILDRCQHAPEITTGIERDFELARMIVASQAPGCIEYIITTFFFPPVTKPNTVLVPPILREAILNAQPSDGGHVLVYQTQKSDPRLLNMLGDFPQQEFVVYGSGATSTPSNVRLREFSEQGFVDDLASSSAVISNGGFTLLGEALYLGKPVYSVPVRNHAEQIVNARYLERLGFGLSSEEFGIRALIEFFDRLDECAANIRAAGRQNGNRELYGMVHSVLRSKA